MRKAGDIVMDLFRDRFGPDFMETARSTAGLFSSWTQVVTEVWPRTFGTEQSREDIPAAAVHSRIRELERGVLLIEADHPGWIQILQTKQAELLSAVQRRHPEQGIRGIAFRLSRDPISPPAPENTSAGCTLQPRVEERSSEYTRAPKDEEFYAALKGLEESIKERNSL